MNTNLTPEQVEKLNQQILSGLSVSENDGVWVAVNQALDYERGKIYSEVIAPDLSNEARQFNAGRAAALEDFRTFLHTKFDEARGKLQGK